LYVDLKTGFPCAIKKIESKSFEKEEQIGYISKLKSICLMKYYDMFELNNNLYIVMQYFENGSLYDLIKSHREKNQKIDIFVYFDFYFNISLYFDVL
jgi:serine/threonine protein kinase